MSHHSPANKQHLGSKWFRFRTGRSLSPGGPFDDDDDDDGPSTPPPLPLPLPLLLSLPFPNPLPPPHPFDFLPPPQRRHSEPSGTGDRDRVGTGTGLGRDRDLRNLHRRHYSPLRSHRSPAQHSASCKKAKVAHHKLTPERETHHQRKEEKLSVVGGQPSYEVAL